MEMIFFLIVLSILCENITADLTCPVSCEHSVNDGFVEKFCSSRSKETEMSGRCCFTANETRSIIGLDLRDCGIVHLNLTTIPKEDIKILDLRDNSKLSNLTVEELVGLTELGSLYLPPTLECPGGDHVWENITLSNDTLKYMWCFNQVKYCDIPNVCSINGQCIYKGPGSTKCVCKSGYFGYKCLQSGTFPVVAFFTSLSICTVAISTFTWFYLRKHVIEPLKAD